jgi:hypothetical protein
MMNKVIVSAASAVLVGGAVLLTPAPTAHAWKDFCTYMDPQYWKGYEDCIGGPPAGAAPAAPPAVAAPPPVVIPTWQPPSEDQFHAGDTPKEGFTPPVGPVDPPAGAPAPALKPVSPDTPPRLSCDGVFSYLCNLVPAMPPAPVLPPPAPGG